MLLVIFLPSSSFCFLFLGREMDLRNTVKNGILYLEDPVDKEWNPHFFVLTQNKLFYTDSYHGAEEVDDETDTEETGPISLLKLKEVF